MFSHYSIIENVLKKNIFKTIYPSNLANISFLQIINLKKNNFIYNHKEKLFNYTNKRQDYILLTNGSLEIEIYDKNVCRYNLLRLNNNSLSMNNKLIANNPVLLNIHACIFYNIKARKASNFIYYSSDYKNIGTDVNFDYYKIDKDNNNYEKYICHEYPFFNFKNPELIV